MLDARLGAVIDSHAFRAELANGHCFTAYIAARDREREPPHSGDTVRVQLSPFAMNAGRILFEG